MPEHGSATYFKYDFFISHAVAPDLDPRFEFGQLYTALVKHGFVMFYDLLYGRPVEVGPFLETAVASSWGALLIITSRAAERGWVAMEWQCFLAERQRRRFPVAAVELESSCPAPGWVDRTFPRPTPWTATGLAANVAKWARAEDLALVPGARRGPRYRTTLPG